MRAPRRSLSAIAAHLDQRDNTEADHCCNGQKDDCHVGSKVDLGTRASRVAPTRNDATEHATPVRRPTGNAILTRTAVSRARAISSKASAEAGIARDAPCDPRAVSIDAMRDDGTCDVNEDSRRFFASFATGVETAFGARLDEAQPRVRAGRFTDGARRWGAGAELRAASSRMQRDLTWLSVLTTPPPTCRKLG